MPYLKRKCQRIKSKHNSEQHNVLLGILKLRAKNILFEFTLPSILLNSLIFHGWLTVSCDLNIMLLLSLDFMLVSLVSYASAFIFLNISK